MGYESRAGKLSQLEIDANLTMGAHSITLGAGQTVDGKDVGSDFLEATDSGLLIPHLILKKASDTNRHSHANPLSRDANTYGKMRTHTFTNGIKGTLRLQFDILRTATATSAQGIMTRNGATPGTGSDIGVEQTTTSTSFDTKTQDIAIDFVAGDTIDYWIKRTGTAGMAQIQMCDVDYDNDIGVAVAAT